MNEIINTLVIKDIKSRMYGDRLAYLWSLINPLAWIGALIIFFAILGKQVPIFTDMISFLVPGMLAYILFRNTINAIMRARKTSHAILHFPSVNFTTVTTAAALTELLNVFIVFTVIIVLNKLLFAKLESRDVLVMIYGYLCAAGTGLFLGRFVAELTDRYPITEKILPIILRPVFWISGVFYTANELPEWLLNIAAWNPLFQSIEIIRDGTFLSYQSRMALYYQPIVCMLVLAGTTAFMRANRPSC